MTIDIDKKHKTSKHFSDIRPGQLTIEVHKSTKHLNISVIPDQGRSKYSPDGKFGKGLLIGGPLEVLHRVHREDPDCHQEPANLMQELTAMEGMVMVMVIVMIIVFTTPAIPKRLTRCRDLKQSIR